MKSNLDLVNETDNFPYYEDNPEKYTKLRSSYWELHLRGGSGPRGYMPQYVFEKFFEMPWVAAWDMDFGRKTLTPGPGCQEDIIRQELEQAREKGVFEVLKTGWRNELYPIYGHNDPSEKTISMERAGSALFGINSYGVHMTVYLNTTEGMKIWVPRRTKNKQTYGGYLDNTVAGGLCTGEQPFECMIRECAEEASLPEHLVRSNAKPCGTVSYIHIRDERAGGETGLVQPECQHVYDMEVGADVIPKPCDNEVEDFYLLTVKQVQEALAEGQFKPNCALVLLDFFVRHGILKGENEPDYIEIVSRLHRKMPFPTS
ncbi:hypothetical protein OEA41_001725 [Lepraria neglecta]|uniref:Nudix hydrolase domain-containing protein n=1 Tax=Lepraria neglecta TaxID=209136 RepID=A0AAE0DLM0_9LECA|nr:hypothetical protein OEA41_001725 [Lepraria neglecta]